MTRFDVVSVFPEFFSVLDLSLIGKARERGILEIHSHDLRDWTDDPHRTVDDTPAGGGAGMVMRADIWGRALDDILSLGADRADDARCVGGAELTDCAGGADRTDRADRAGRTVLAIPTPSGKPLTQRDCERFAADFDHVVIACGRYEGIDARVAAHYAGQGVTVHEYSLGDYVLNGGEVAAVALIEAVGRLLPGWSATRNRWSKNRMARPDSSNTRFLRVRFPGRTKRSLPYCCPAIMGRCAAGAGTELLRKPLLDARI